MAKKGGIQQLQAELNDDEELEKFLERPGLLVIDVYSEWCGPCLGMVSALRKIKLEIGGDNLQLAVAKSDNIKAFERFQRKSEPTWLFVVNGRAVNIAFGTNVPVLNKLIISELNQINAKNRPNYDVSDYQPVEIEMRKVIEEARAAAEALELAEAKKARLDYLTFVTDSIMENLPDIGVTVFGPQVNRDMFKKIAEPAEALKIQCKDRKMTIITPENFQTINYACQNPLTPDVQEIMNEKEVMVCFWKLPEDQGQKLLFTYANDLTKTDQHKDEETGRTVKVPPILTTLDLKVQVEWKEGDEWFEDEPDEPPPAPLAAESSASHLHLPDEEEKHVEDAVYEDGEEEYLGEEEGGDGAEPPPTEPMPLEPMPDFDFGLDLDLDGEEEEVEEENEEDVNKKRFRTKRIRVPPIWVPNNQRTHAALIYVLFRSQTTPFLPPDPVPEPPHIIMAFDSYKKKDLVSFADRHKTDIPLYGFFTTDDASEAQLIANTAEKYMSAQKTQSDKLVLKVNKQTSHTMLALATYNPSYVSPNTIIGAEEALKFFPPDYVTGSQEALAETAEGAGDKKKKKKKRSSKTAAPDAGGEDDTPREGDEGEGAGDGEGAGEGDMGEAGEGGEGADGEGGEGGEGDAGEGGEAGYGEGGEGAGEGGAGEGEGDHGEGGEAGFGEGAGEGAGGEDGEAGYEGGAAEDGHGDEGEAGAAEGGSDAAAPEKEAETAAEAPEAASEAPATPPEAEVAAAPEAPEDGPATPPPPTPAEPGADADEEG